MAMGDDAASLHSAFAECCRGTHIIILGLRRRSSRPGASADPARTLTGWSTPGGPTARACRVALGHRRRESNNKEQKALGGDTQGPPGWEPDLRWRGWGAEFHLRDRNVLVRACSVPLRVKKRLMRLRGE